MRSLKTFLSAIVLTLGLIGNAAAANVLSFVDFSFGANYWTQVFTQRGDTVTLASDTADLTTKLGQGPWDFVVVSQNSLSDASYLAALQAFITAGGKVVFNNWYPNAGFDTAFQASAGGTNQTEVTANNPTGVAMTLTNPGYGIFSQTLTPLPGAQSICEFASGSCAVVGNSGRTLRLGLIPDTLPFAQATAFLSALVDAIHSSTKTLAENLACGRDGINGLMQPVITGPAQKNMMLGLLNLVNIYKDTPYRSLSLNALNSAIARVDGCALRTTPDGIAQGGTGIDFVTTCPAQGPIYACLKAAQGQLTGP